MKLFIKNILLFCIIPILYFSLNIIINIYIYSHSYIELKHKNILIIGDSHTEKSLNPIFFHSAQNISQTAEPYILTFWKIKKIIKSYKPDTLIIGFSPHNISAFNDQKFSNEILFNYVKLC